MNANSPVDEAAQQQLLQEAVTQIKSGLNEQAVNGPFAQIIHTYETAYAHSTKRLYCAESIVETMLYLTQAAHDHQSAKYCQNRHGHWLITCAATPMPHLATPRKPRRA